MRIYPKANIQNLMVMAARDCQTFGLTMGFAVAQSYMNRIAERALELKDEKLMACCYQLCLIGSEKKEEVKELEEMVDRVMADKAEKVAGPVFEMKEN